MKPLRLLPVAILALSAAAARGEAARSLNPLASLDESSLKNFVEKPLFEPSRRPPQAVAPAVVVALPPPPMIEQPPAMHLLGVVEGAHSLAAIVHRDDTGSTETLHPGDHIGGWRIELGPAALRVVNGERAFDYALFRNDHESGPVSVTPPWPSAPAVATRESKPSGAAK